MNMPTISKRYIIRIWFLKNFQIWLEAKKTKTPLISQGGFSTALDTVYLFDGGDAGT